MKREEGINDRHWDSVEEAGELLNEGSYTEALAELQRVLETDKDNPYAYFFLGVACYELDHKEAARDAYEACLRLAPAYLGAKVALTHVYRELGDTKKALQKGISALSQHPDDSDALYAVGMAYLSRGEKDPARKYFEAFLLAKPEFEAATEVNGILASLNESKGEA